MHDLYLVLPNIRSCHNVGAMFRTADGCGFDKIYLCGYTATPPKRQIDKVSLGAELWMPWEQHKDAVELLTSLKKQGVTVVALEKTDTSTEIAKTSLKGPLALVVGNEVVGIPEEVLACCDKTVHIPMYGRKESFNVSIAAGIAMHEIRKTSRCE